MPSRENLDFDVVPGRRRPEPRIQWKAHYPMIAIGAYGVPTDLPGKEAKLAKKDAQEKRDVLLLSEREAGTRNFLDWWRGRLSADKKPSVLVHGNAWGEELFEWPTDQHRDETVINALRALGAGPNVVDRATALARWAATLTSPFTLLIRELSSMGEPAAVDVATALRVLRELDRNSYPNLHVLVTDTSEAIYVDSRDRSGYGALCHQYRIAPLGSAAIEALGGWEGPREKPKHKKDEIWPQLSFADGASEVFLEHTGGQRLLVRHLLHRLRERARSVGCANLDLARGDIEGAARQMGDSPPSEVKLWQEDLQQLLKREPNLVHRMRAYVLGETIGPAEFPPPANERSLFIAGWLKPDRDGRWGIASLFHVHLARPVLDEFRHIGR
ncbi:MAG: hypothetical protein HY699_04665 [Deltaproteobacteria bacterium]|nr:hypothetical protein [Deltaproteobacteria bacterium]